MFGSFESSSRLQFDDFTVDMPTLFQMLCLPSSAGVLAGLGSARAPPRP